jgi:hypothetical protein
MTAILTSRKLASILRKAGFEPSKKQTTSVRGWYRYTAGYTIENVTSGAWQFEVSYRNDSQGYGTPKNVAEMIAKFGEILEAAGLTVLVDSTVMVAA